MRANIPVHAQIVSDTTLGVESSVVGRIDTNGLEVVRIGGGATRETNLFHSFDQFNVNRSQQVYFNNPNGVETILTRVTGTDRSEILGTLGVDGSADLFLLNPNGILFGKTARLDVAGSFIATTADALQFDALGTFSGRNPEPPPSLLTIAPSAFLFGPSLSGDIVNRSTVVGGVNGDFPNLEVGLQVPHGEDLLLVGGDVLVNGGRLSAFGGRIGIGSVAGEGRVELGGDRTLTFADNLLRGRVRFENNARVETALDGGGDIQVMAGTIEVLSSLVQTGLRSRLDSVGNQAGDIVFDATENITVDGIFDPNSRLQAGISSLVNGRSIGNAGDISIATNVLNVLNGSQIGSNIRGTGEGGSVTITATEQITVDHATASDDNPSAIFSDILRSGVGSAGSVTINTPVLNLLNGSEIGSSTRGSGNGGSVTITATERITVDGTSASEAFPSLIASDTLSKNRGDAGSVTITTPILDVLNGGAVSSDTFGFGNAGSVTILATERVTLDGTPRDRQIGGVFSDVGEGGVGDAGSVTIMTPILNVLNGAAVGSGTLKQGNGENVTIIATERITVDGRSVDGKYPSAILSEVRQSAMGDGGRITLTTPVLHILNGAEINSESRGDGNAGEIDITAGLLILENGSNILTETRSGDGGGINLDVGNVLMVGNSGISSEAGTEADGGNGGNMNIRSRFIIANQNSDISANAFSGRGGNIDLTASGGLFGIEFRPQQTPRSDITASSQLGLDGDVVINTPDIDPSQGLVQLPVNPVAPPPINAVCEAVVDGGSEFTRIGRGGIPAAPTDSLGTPSPWEDWYIAEPSVIEPSFSHHDDTHNTGVSNAGTNRPEMNREGMNRAIAPPPLAEAQGWRKTNDGAVQLVTTAHLTTPTSGAFPLNDCRNHPTPHPSL